MIRIQMFAVFLVFLAVSSTLPEVCEQNSIWEMNALRAVHLTSYCLIESIVEDANNLPESYGEDFDCSPKALYQTEGGQEYTTMFLMACLMKVSREPGDVLPLSPDTIKQRIASAVTPFLEANENKHRCTPKKLEGVSYPDALDNENEYFPCMLQQTLIDLSHPNIVYDMNF